VRRVEFRQETAIWSLAGALAILAAVVLASIDAGLIALAWRLTAPADFGPAPAFRSWSSACSPRGPSWSSTSSARSTS